METQETQNEGLVLSPEAKKFHEGRASDGRSFDKTFPQLWQTLKAEAKRLGHELSIAEYRVIADFDLTMLPLKERGDQKYSGGYLVNCAKCASDVEDGVVDKTKSTQFAPRMVALVSNRTGEVIRGKDGKPVAYVGNYVAIRDSYGDWTIHAGCGNPFHDNSHAYFFRTILQKKDRRTGKEIRLEALTYEVANEVPKRIAERQNQQWQLEQANNAARTKFLGNGKLTLGKTTAPDEGRRGRR